MQNVVYLRIPEFEFRQFLMRLVVAMSRLGMSNTELALRAGLTKSTVTRILRRQSKNMYVGTVAKLAMALNLATDFLLGVREARSQREQNIEVEAQENLRFERRRAERVAVVVGAPARACPSRRWARVKVTAEVAV